MIIQILVTVFVIFATSRLLLRFRGGDVGMGALIFWLFIWGSIEAMVWIPEFFNKIASEIGIGRGIDAAIYASIVLLFYTIYRGYVKTEFIEREITSLVRKLAINEKKLQEKNNSQTSTHSPNK